jgi:hypothetical protein
MKTFHELRRYLNDLPLISEELHQSIQNVLNADHIEPQYKLHHITTAIRGAIKRGEDTGLEDAKPKKGSSRAVFFPKEPTKLKIDGHDTQMHTALKVAFPGQLDKYRHSDEPLLGEEQNRVEGDHWTNSQYGVLRQGDRHDEYHTNEHGFLAPMLHAHDEGHYVHFGKIEPVKAGDFKAHTKAPGFEKGISHDEMFDYLNHHYSEAHGQKHYGKTSPERIEQLEQHPMLERMHDWMLNTGAHPADLNKRNMGVWTHPVTQKKHIVVSDYGFTGDVAKMYGERRKRSFQANRGY